MYSIVGMRRRGEMMAQDATRRYHELAAALPKSCAKPSAKAGGAEADDRRAIIGGRRWEKSALDEDNQADFDGKYEESTGLLYRSAKPIRPHAA